jgi:hypothetical protein
MPYTSLQFIGYAIDTAPKESKPPVYLGLDNPLQDIEARCQLMLRAMTTAKSHLPQSSPPSGEILTVFLAPEFFFRGKQGAYQIDQTHVAIARLQEIASAPEWTDWTFGFGTIVGVFGDETSLQDAVINFALIQQGGLEEQSSSGSRIVMKEYMSNIDFIDEASAEGLLLENVRHLKPINLPGPGREQQRFDYDGAGIFNLGGLTWAAEICLDHTLQSGGRLIQSPQLPGENEVQVQLIPSCGASIRQVHVVAQTGGYALNVDGQHGPRSNLEQVIAPAQTIPIPPTVSYNVNNGDIVLNDASPPVDVPISELYADGPGKVVIYAPIAPLAVPPSLKVQGMVRQAVWQASVDYKFSFDLIYDSAGNYVTVLCEVTSSKIDFFGFKYFLPLQVARDDSNGKPVIIKNRLIPGTGGFDLAVWCKIAVPDFDFEGIAFQFGKIYGTPVETIWK